MFGPLIPGGVTLELTGMSGIAARLIQRKVYQRLQSLTEEEVLRWRAGDRRISEEVIEVYRDKLLANRELVLSAMDSFTPEEISGELVERRPDLARYWKDEVFFRRLLEEKRALTDFLRGASRSAQAS